MHFSSSTALKAIVSLTLVSNVNGFWRMPCLARSGLARIDPLVSYGTVSDHAHAIHGSSGFSDTSGYSDLMAGSCTSCEVAQDKSAYWTPALYFQSASTGQFSLVPQVGGMLSYYLLYPNAGNTSLSAFPAGFQMISGDTNQRNFTYPVPDIDKSNWNQNPYNTQAFLRQAALGFNCLNYGIAPEGSLYRHFLPDKAYLDANCVNGVRFELMFPSCWNGNDVDSADHKSHVAFPSEVMTGDCPSDFPVRLPSLFYETIWNTYAFNGQAGQFLMANGDPTGYGYHGDFIMGWDPAFLQDAVNTCTNPSGQVSDCALFTLQDSSVYGNCNITAPAALAGDDVVGPASTLPGNVPIVSGPGYASGAAAGEAGSTPAPSSAGGESAAVPTLSHSPGQSIASTDTYVPGGVFVAVSSTSLSSSAPTTSAVEAPAAAAVTPAPAPVATEETESFFSTAYTTSGQVVEEVLWVEELVTVTAEQTATVTVQPGRRKRNEHLHQHRREFFS